MENLDTKARILRVAERLFALQGVDAVSLRTISSEVGQKNKTAAQYHFGSKEGLIRAILLDRMEVINHNRQQLLDVLLNQGDPDLHQLVEVLFKPFVQLLQDDGGGRFYILFTAQLFSQGRAVALFSDAQLEFKTQQQLFKLITGKLKKLPRSVLNQRLGLMAGLLAQAAAAKDYELSKETSQRGMTDRQRQIHIKKFSRELVDFVVGGLTVPIHCRD